MNSVLQRFSSVKLINISIITLIVLLFTGSSVIYAKKDPNDIRNQPHDFNKFVCGTMDRHLSHSKSMMRHAENLLRLSKIQRSPAVFADFDDGDIAVIVDDGTLIIPPAANLFDLDGLTLLFTPNDSGGYDVDTTTFTFYTALDINLNAGDDTNHPVNFTSGFSFSYFGTSWDSVYVRSNGNVTFGSLEGTSPAWNPADLFLEIPIIAAYFGDLDPAVAGGVFVKQDIDKFIITWNNLPEFGRSNSNTIQLVLFDDSTFQFSYNGMEIATPVHGESLVGINSGAADPTLKAVSFSNYPIDGGSADLLFEFFRPASILPALDIVAIANRFYETHGDLFDHLVLFTDFQSDMGVAQAFYRFIQDSLQGVTQFFLGGNFDASAAYGSAGKLHGLLNMNELDAWPDLPDTRFRSDGNNYITIMGQEAGHQWNSFLRFDPGTGLSDLLLGRSFAHWSPYLGTEVNSMMGGSNQWVETSPNIFVNRSLVDYYSNLDMYAMGIRAPEEVPPVFYISSASNNTLTAREAGSFQTNAGASGTRVNVTIEEVITAMGTRLPARDDYQQDHHQAYILLVRSGTVPSGDNLSKLRRFIDDWRPYWSLSTDGRSTMSTNLDSNLPVAVIKGTVTDQSTGSPVTEMLAYRVDWDIEQTVAAGGYYTWRTLADSLGEPESSFTQIISAFPYFPDTSVVPNVFPNTHTQNISLTKLPLSSIAGTITDSNTGATVEAQVVLHAFSDIIGRFEVEAVTNGSGGYSFADLYVTHPGVISYEGISVFPDFPYIVTEIGEVTVLDGIVSNVDIQVDAGDLLLVNDDPNGDYSNFFTDVLDSLNLTYHHWLTSEKGIAPAPAAAVKMNYSIIVWYTGDETTNSISAAEEDSLMAFLDAGGRLFLSGQNAVENLPAGGLLLMNYLQASHGGNSTQGIISAVSGNPVMGGEGLIGIIGAGGADNQTSADILIPSGIASEAILYGVAGPDVAAVSVDDGNYKIFLTGFGFEAVVAGNNILTPPIQIMYRVLDWFGAPVVSVEDEIALALPKKFSLEQNYPNPFNPETSISFSIPQDATVRLTIYNILGQKISTLIDGQRSSGVYTINWNGRNDVGNQVASGLYFYRIEARHSKNGEQRIFVDAKKMLLLR